MKKKKTVNPYVRKIIVTVRVNSEEMRELLLLAGNHTYGNVGALLRKAALEYRPKK